MAASFLEQRLVSLIKLRLRPEIDSDLDGRVFKGYGALATFSARIDVGFLLQLYPEETRRLLYRLKDIRNDAAHETSPISFDLPSIRDRCLSIHAGLLEVIRSSADHTWQLIAATGSLPDGLDQTLYDDGFEGKSFSLNIEATSAREAFLVTVKTLLFEFHQVGQIFQQTRMILRPLPLPDKPE